MLKDVTCTILTIPFATVNLVLVKEETGSS